MPKKEAQKAANREYMRRRYWENPERFRAESSEYGKRRRAADKAAGITPKPRAPRTVTAKAAAAERAKIAYWENPEPQRATARERARRRRATDRDAVNGVKRKAYRANREHILEQQSGYREAHRDEIRARARARIDHSQNRERVRDWQTANPAKVRQAKLRRRAREMSAPVIDFTVDQWREVLAEFDGCCAYCPASATTQDHLTPLSRGGSHTASNIVPACKPCNSRKGTRTLFEFVEFGGFLVDSRAGGAA